MLKTIDDLDVAGRRVLLRLDLNVPIDHGRVADDGRIRASLPTVRGLVSRGAKVIVCAHLGSPGGRPDPRYTLVPVAARLAELLGRRIVIAADTVGAPARAAIAALRPGDIAVLENLGFNKGETSEDAVRRGRFASRLAALADVYVGDAFSAVHRRHASVYDVALRLPHAAGYLIQAEVAALSRLTRDIRRPYVTVLGGANAADKMGAVGGLMKDADTIVVGGAMALPFLAARGHKVGTSSLDPADIDMASDYLDQAEQAGVRIVLPSNVVVAAQPAADAPRTVVDVAAIPPDQMVLDIGPRSARSFAAEIGAAGTVFWSGPMGVSGLARYARGTRAVIRALTAGDAFTVIGGADTAAAIHALGIADTAFDHVCAGGDASLEFIEGKTLPGLTALQCS